MSFLDRLFSREGSTTPSAAPATTELARQAAPALELRIEAGIASDPGCVRELNEDTARIIRPTVPDELAKRGILAVVCDGMGGHEAGEIASRLAVETIVRRFEDDDGDSSGVLPRAIEGANRAIFEAAARNAKLKGMGTTVTALMVRGGEAYGAHVGDSRIYLVRGGEIFLMTEDHSAVMELVRQGAITRDEARHHPEKNVISRALGGHPQVRVDTWPRPFSLLPGDSFLLCSDGLTDLVDEATILATVRDVHPQVACDRLVTLARAGGGHDNITVAILGMSTVAEPSARPVRETRALEVPQ